MRVVSLSMQTSAALLANLATGSTFIELDEVRVPLENLLGEENQGFPLIMSSKSP